MSASPLPALNTGSPTTAIHSNAASASPTDQARQSNQDSAFNTRLQDERQRQSGASSTAPRPPVKSNAGASPDTSTSKNSAQASSTTSGAASTATAAASGASTSTASDINVPGASDSSDPSSAEDAATASLATTVLGLIDQSSGNAGEAVTGATNGVVTKGKTPPQADNGNAPVQPQPSVAPNAGTVVPVPVPALVGQAATQSDGTAATSGAVPATMAASNAPLAQIAGKSSGAFSATDNADTSEAADTDPTSANAGGDTAAGSLLGQIADGAAQAATGALFGVGHAALSFVAASTAMDSQPQSGSDLAAMNGALSAPAFAMPANSILAPHTLSINAPVNSPTFSQQLGQQVAWLGSQDIKQAQIRLNPQELGPLDVKVSIEHGRVDVAFMAQHPATVAAVQQSLSQLNQMLGGHGLSLGQATVGQQASQQQFAGSQSQSSSPGSTVAEEEPADGLTSASAQPVAIGLVDAFA
jgi:flagellar hook-length control protein FliK